MATTCYACQEGLGNQEAHYGGCMQDPMFDELLLEPGPEEPFSQTQAQVQEEIQELKKENEELKERIARLEERMDWLADLVNNK